MEFKNKAEVFTVAYIHNFFGIGNDEKFVKLEVYKQLKKENEELKWEQKQILEDNDNYQKENEELKIKLDKAKNRTNCKNGIYSITGPAYFDCKLKIDKCLGCDKWELAE